jgi:SAM-dependent methyltransferase
MMENPVQKLYNTYPFPPDPLLNEPPPGYNWRWNWVTAYNFCTGRKPPTDQIRILDAGCGTGVSTEYLIYLNPHAEIVAIDLSENALAIAQKRCQQSGVAAKHQAPITFQQMQLENAAQLSGEFDLINSVGVLHHLPDPHKGIKALAQKLAKGGIMHIFVYAELGRWAIQLMQEAIATLQGEQKGDYRDGVQVGRQIFANLPEDNPLVKYEKTRWSLENQRDECFADMYVHPVETDYNINTLFELIDASGLEFVGFSNPNYWYINRLIGKCPDLIERTKNLNEREIYRLIELLDPTLSHYEFFLAKPPLIKYDWSDDNLLKNARPEVNPCLNGFPEATIFNHEYQIVRLSPEQIEFMQACNGNNKVGEILANMSFNLAEVRQLIRENLIILTP